MLPVLMLLGGLFMAIEGLAGKGSCMYWKGSGDLVACKSSSEQVTLGIVFLGIGAAWLWWRSKREN